MKIYFGNDIVKISRIQKACERHPQFLERVFTAGEIAHAQGRVQMQWASLAGIYAAKEAAVKALTTGFRKGKFTDVEISWSELGQPMLQWHGVYAEQAQCLGIISASVSISHEKEMAIAGVVLLGDANANR